MGSPEAEGDSEILSVQLSFQFRICPQEGVCQRWRWQEVTFIGACFLRVMFSVGGCFCGLALCEMMGRGGAGVDGRRSRQHRFDAGLLHKTFK